MIRLLLTIFLLTHCAPLPEPPDVEGDCESAERNLEELGCEEMLAIPGWDEIPYNDDDIPWLTWCKQIQESDIAELDLGCLTEAKGCKEAEGCGVK